jgi:protocatechuate 3,4-dioxygenase beta subunit
MQSTFHGAARTGGTVMSSRFIDRHRLFGKRIGLVAGHCLVVTLAVFVPALEAADPPPKTFTLTVVGPDGKVVPQAAIDVQSSPLIEPEQIREGQFVHGGSYRISVKADAKGRVVLEVPAKLKQFNVSIEQAGFGPYWAAWDFETHSESLPSAFTAELDAAWSIGGIVVDEHGKSVPDAKVGLWVLMKTRPGDSRALGSGANARTKSDGRWRFDSVPVSKNQVSVEIHQSDFMPERRSLTRAEFELKPAETPHARIVLKRGLVVTGKVADETGKPIGGAIVFTKFQNDIRKAVSGDDGVYRLAGCEPRMVRLVVWAKGRATDMKQVQIEPKMPPVNFEMKPGGTVRIRVLDERGKPIPKARIFFQRWRGFFQYFEFNQVSQFTGRDGVWEWNEAPLDEFKADICRPDGMELSQQSLVARKEEYVFRPPPALVVTGKVIDSQTKQPIKSFRVVPGVRSSPQWMNWDRGGTFTATGGRYRFVATHDSFAHLVRIEADGYMPAESRNIKSNEGNVTIDFALSKAKDFDAVVLTPDGRPAANAHVALGVAGSQISIKNGDIDPGMTFSARAETDAAGRLHLPPQDKSFYLVITHPSGYAEYKPGPAANRRTINLDPWSRVEGTFRIGEKLRANIAITINRGDTSVYGENVPHIFTDDETTTGPDGRFVFERVMAGSGWIGRRVILMVNEGALEAASSCWVHSKFPRGKTVHVELGGTGRPVVGKLQAPPGLKKPVSWSFAEIRAEPVDKGSGQSFYYTVSPNRDGAFRIDDVQGGLYRLNVRFFQNSAGHLFNRRFYVRPTVEKTSAEPDDLGVLTLDKN